MWDGCVIFKMALNINPCPTPPTQTPLPGTFRSDATHPAGPFTLGDLMAVLPMMDPTCMLEATGAQVLAALENGVSM